MAFASPDQSHPSELKLEHLVQRNYDLFLVGVPLQTNLDSISWEKVELACVSCNRQISHTKHYQLKLLSISWYINIYIYEFPVFKAVVLYQTDTRGQWQYGSKTSLLSFASRVDLECLSLFYFSLFNCVCVCVWAPVHARACVYDSKHWIESLEYVDYGSQMSTNELYPRSFISFPSGLGSKLPRLVCNSLYVCEREILLPQPHSSWDDRVKSQALLRHLC